MKAVYPFAAIVAQDDLKLALLIAAVDQGVGGVLVFGDRGTGKSTAVRALADLLPKRAIVDGCAYNCTPDALAGLCARCVPPAKGAATKTKTAAPKTRQATMPVVDLPLGATEDRVIGALDIEKALGSGEKAFEPGLLARAHGGFLYIDEVNLLEDHLVDLLLDVTASGENVVEREGLSVRHPARFVLVGSGNPEEGELRPQLLDRFGLSLDVKTPQDVATRIEVVRRRDAFDRNPDAFVQHWSRENNKIRRKVSAARDRVRDIDTSPAVLERAVQICMAVGSDGLRGELTLVRAARAFAALEGDATIADKHLRRVAPFALRHRLRRNVLDEVDSGVRVERALAGIFAS
jgi:magnesium chelatase subunit I